MSQSWSGTRRVLEEDLLCPALRGRVQYFVTRYHGAPDRHGRACVRVDGVEHVMANPYGPYVRGYDALEQAHKVAEGVPTREWVGHGGVGFRYEEENRRIEDEVARLRWQDGVFEEWEFLRSVEAYRNAPIEESLTSGQPLIRLLAVLDRRVGKRRLLRLREELGAQPEWLRFFYRLRLEAEGIPVEKTEDRTQKAQNTVRQGAGR